MDKEYMRDYYRNRYDHAYDVAVAGSVAYENEKNIRQEKEDELIRLLGGTGTIAYQKFDEYITAYMQEMDVMLEEIYLLGALDRERMLR